MKAIAQFQVGLTVLNLIKKQKNGYLNHINKMKKYNFLINILDLDNEVDVISEIIEKLKNKSRNKSNHIPTHKSPSAEGLPHRL